MRWDVLHLKEGEECSCSLVETPWLYCMYKCTWFVLCVLEKLACMKYLRLITHSV